MEEKRREAQNIHTHRYSICIASFIVDFCWRENCIAIVFTLFIDISSSFYNVNNSRIKLYFIRFYSRKEKTNTTVCNVCCVRRPGDSSVNGIFVFFFFGFGFRRLTNTRWEDCVARFGFKFKWSRNE